ncbi:MAG: hypothetical protein KGJ79_12080 [Alphaproteobacteria bacterium]|nr:hypothetical protein [Alphaproteobacteria bacterium]MDE2111872.1 hypothetical protein [Alphaproteobacteria bacterium]MDE2493612.1 hypothetical protein [Alphaproteobacteria bacterium]
MSKRLVFGAVLCLAATLPSVAFGATKTSTFKADIAALIGTALNEAPTDFTNIATTPDAKTGMNLVKPFGPSFEQCVVTYLDQADGMPKALFCTLKPIPDAELAARRADVEQAADTQGFSGWSKTGSDSGIQWKQGRQILELDIGNPVGKRKMRTLYLGFSLAPHIRYSPLGPSIAHFLDAAVAGAPSKYDNIPSVHTDDNMFFDVAPVYGESLPYCRKFMSSFECYSSNFVDAPDAQLEAAKEAVAAALPANFVLQSCGKNVGNEPVCTWYGPGKLSLLLIVESGGKDGLSHIRLWFDADSDKS